MAKSIKKFYVVLFKLQDPLLLTPTLKTNLNPGNSEFQIEVPYIFFFTKFEFDGKKYFSLNMLVLETSIIQKCFEP